MKKVNAIWEKRNLGLRVCELTFGTDDDNREVEKLISDNEFDYYVARVHSENIELVHDLETIGFRYLENQLSVRFTADEIRKIAPEWIARFSDYTCSLLSTEDEFNEIIARTHKGLFEKDRFSVDPLISRELPDRRIAYWIVDMHKDPRNSVYLIRKNKIIAGFFITKMRDDTELYVEMAAIFSEFRGKGLSFLLIYNILLKAAAEGANVISASLSVNNINTINTFTRFINFRIKEVFIIMRRYNPLRNSKTVNG